MSAEQYAGERWLRWYAEVYVSRYLGEMADEDVAAAVEEVRVRRGGEAELEAVLVQKHFQRTGYEGVNYGSGL